METEYISYLLVRIAPQLSPDFFLFWSWDRSRPCTSPSKTYHVVQDPLAYEKSLLIVSYIFKHDWLFVVVKKYISRKNLTIALKVDFRPTSLCLINIWFVQTFPFETFNWRMRILIHNYFKNISKAFMSSLPERNWNWKRFSKPCFEEQNDDLWLFSILK